MKTIKNYSNLIKLEHTLFSLPMILAGAFLAANGIPSLNILFLIILAGIGARTSALAINRILDRKIDVLNPRTKTRELPSGKVSLNGAILITVAGLIIYFLSAYKICKLVLFLSPIPLVVFIIYPLMKRFTPLCHLGVGLGLALAPLGGYIAVNCSFADILPAILLTFFTFFWVSGFDIIYATLDEKFDLKQGVFSMVSVYGRSKALFVSAVFHILAFVSLVVLFILEFKSSIVSLIILLFIGYLLYLEHKKSENVDLAFFKINIVIGLFVFVFILAGIYLN